MRRRNAGRTRNTSGKSIFTGAARARSTAALRRVSRTSAAKRDISSASDEPRRSVRDEHPTARPRSGNPSAPPSPGARRAIAAEIGRAERATSSDRERATDGSDRPTDGDLRCRSRPRRDGEEIEEQGQLARRARAVDEPPGEHEPRRSEPTTTRGATTGSGAGRPPGRRREHTATRHGHARPLADHPMRRAPARPSAPTTGRAERARRAVPTHRRPGAERRSAAITRPTPTSPAPSLGPPGTSIAKDGRLRRDDRRAIAAIARPRSRDRIQPKAPAWRTSPTRRAPTGVVFAASMSRRDTADRNKKNPIGKQPEDRGRQARLRGEGAELAGAARRDRSVVASSSSAAGSAPPVLR